MHHELSKKDIYRRPVCLVCELFDRHGDCTGGSRVLDGRKHFTGALGSRSRGELSEFAVVQHFLFSDHPVPDVTCDRCSLHLCRGAIRKLVAAGVRFGPQPLRSHCPFLLRVPVDLSVGGVVSPIRACPRLVAILSAQHHDTRVKRSLGDCGILVRAVDESGPRSRLSRIAGRYVGCAKRHERGAVRLRPLHRADCLDPEAVDRSGSSAAAIGSLLEDPS